MDLHCHTQSSDGRFSPGEVIDAAVRKGLSTLAITDHDNIRGSLEAAPLSETLRDNSREQASRNHRPR